MSLTAQTRPGRPGVLPTVALSTGTVPTTGTVTIDRDPSGPAGPVVRGTPVHVSAGGAVVLVDAEPPFGVPVTYTATHTDDTTGAVTQLGQVTVPPLEYGADVHVLSAVDGTAVPVPVVSEQDARRSWAGTALRLSGRTTPAVRLDARPSWRWQLQLWTADTDADDALDALLTPGRPILLRHTDPACRYRAGWVAVFDVASDWMVDDSRTYDRRWTLDVQTVDAPDPAAEAPVVTLADLHTYEPGTLANLAARAPTLLALAELVTADAY